MKTILNLILLLLIKTTTTSQCFQNISVGFEHNLIIKTDGTLWSWGSNNSGELGINSGVQKISIPQLINSNNNWQSVFAGYNTSFAIKDDGTLWAWGDGGSGKLGFGNQGNVFTPTQMGTDTDWVYVTSGSHTIAKKNNGTLWGWGSNIYGQLNIDTSSLELNPIQISMDTDWAKVVAVGLHTLAIKNDGTLWACGLNDFGQLGDGTTSNKLTFVQIGNDNDWIDIAGGEKHSVALKSNGTILGWGQNHIPFTTGYIFGNNYPSQILNPTLLSSDTDWDEISCKNGFLLGKKLNGTVWYLENNIFQLVNNDNDWHNIYSGNSHSFLQKLDGTLWGYGNNSKGQLGLGDAIQNVIVPTQLDCATLGIDDITNTIKFIIYPNPVNNFLYIQNSSGNSIDCINVTDLTGKVIFKCNNCNYINKINFSSFQKGIYIVSMISSNQITNYKVVKK